MDGSYYDYDYYDNPIKSGFSGAYVWGRLGSYFEKTAKHIVTAFHPTTVLDLGCARGFMVKALQREGKYAIGIDFSRYAVDTCDKEVIGSVLWGDITRTIALPETDLVLCLDVMEHIAENKIEQTLDNIFSTKAEYIMFNIGLAGQDEAVLDKSHVTLKSREWWLDRLNREGHDVLDSMLYYKPDIWWFNTPEMMFILRRR